MTDPLPSWLGGKLWTCQRSIRAMVNKKHPYGYQGNTKASDEPIIKPLASGLIQLATEPRGTETGEKSYQHICVWENKCNTGGKKATRVATDGNDWPLHGIWRLWRHEGSVGDVRAAGSCLTLPRSIWRRGSPASRGHSALTHSHS